MKIEELIPKTCVTIEESISTKKGILERIASLAAKHPALADHTAESIYTLLEKREEVSSTGFQGGMAIPHCRVQGIAQFVLGLVVVPKGLNFHAVDGKNTQIFVFIIAPEGQTMDHLKLLSAISQALINKANREQLLIASSPKDLRKSFLGMLPAEIGVKPKEQALVELILENDDLFEEILEKLLGLVTSPPTVVQGKSAIEYIHRVPLFADLWSMRQESYCKIIRFIVDKRLTNEAVRRIEEVTGPLSEGEGVLVFTTEIQYLGGKLRD
ncbi:PTS sugar transporter subunit IIA [Myxococcota bacterium]|nr:PTS sugar transporter subunit IIA [Myxococcota bacterium]MBU1535711.1 PTS sugar transporter subunit IIA [Myxococcota bacterium]